MLKLVANIAIKTKTKTWTFTKINACEIVRDIGKITATCVITLPKKTRWADETSIPVKRGDSITVELGYDKPELVFKGYIVRVNADTPVRIECEDEMFTLKQTDAKKKSYSDAKVKTLLADQLPKGMKYSVLGEQSIGRYVVSTNTVAELLGALAEQGISSFFALNGMLHCGLLHSHTEQQTGKKQVFKDGADGNIIDAGGLEYYTKEEIKLRVKAEGTNKKGKKISVTVGDKDGELRSFFKYNTTKEQLKAEAAEKLKTWKIAGLSGDFTTFGLKPVFLLDRIKIELERSPKAVYSIAKNTLTYNTDGYRQKISIVGKKD